MKKCLLTIIACLITTFAYLQPLSGPYTINPGLPAGGGNYQSFNAFKADLSTFGVIGPVTVNVKQGTYNEQVSFGSYVGAAAINMVTIQSDPTNISPVVISYASTVTTEGTFSFNGTRFIRFIDLELSAIGATYKRNIFLTPGTIASGDLFFENCTFVGPTATTGSTNGAHVYGSSPALTGAGINFDGCTFTNNSYGIYVTGASASRSTKVSINDCEFNGHPGYTIYTTYFDSLIVTNNHINNVNSTSAQYGVYSTNLTSSTAAYARVENNDIRMSTTSTVYGVYLTYFGSSALNPSRIVNNMISNAITTSTSGTRYGIYPLACGNINVLHNTINIQDGSATAARALYISGTTTTLPYVQGNYNIQNNVIINTGLGIGIEIAGTYASLISNLNYNVYNGSGTNTFENNNIQYATLPAWQTATGYDMNSYFGDPIFVSATDLHMQGSLANNVGNNAASVPNDIDGQIRPLAPSTTVDIGADEFIGPSCNSPLNFAVLNSDTSSAVFQWTAGGSETQWKLTYGPVGFIPSNGSSSTIANSNPDTISGLIPNQFYEAYIQAICASNDTSIIIGPIAFNSYGLGQYMETTTECDSSGFVDISGLFTANSLAADGEAGFALPWTFYYQGTPVNQITIGNNGVIVFNTISAVISSTNANTLATTAATGLYPFWDDLDDAGAQIYWGSVGTAPNRRFIVQWNAKHDAYGTGLPFVFQVIMEETTGKIYYQYLNKVTGSTAYDNGLSATIGLSGDPQDFALSYNNVSFLQNNSCAKFYYTKCPKPTNLVFNYIFADEAGIGWTAGLSNETNWTVIYGPAGFDPNTSGVIQTNNVNSAILQSLEQLTTYDVYIYSDCANGEQSFALYAQFTTLPLCTNPGAFAGSTSVDSIFTSWTWAQTNPTYIADGFEMKYGIPGFDPLTDGSIDISDATPGDTTTNSNLLAGAVYELYIRATCDTLVSGFVGPISVIMPLTNNNVCAAETLPVDGVSRIFSNVGATIETNEQNIAPPVTGNQTTDGWGNNTLNFTVWYKFIAPTSGNMRINGTDRNFNGQMAVYQATTCNNFATFNLIAANDDALEGLSFAPNFTVCGMTPGAEYYLLFDSYSTTLTGQFAVNLSSINLEAGSPGQTVNVCYKDTVNLFSGISGYQSGGVWNDLDGTFHIINDSLFRTQGLAYDTYNFEYQLEDGCASDEVMASFTIFAPSLAGNDGSMTICRNEPANVFASLSGTINSGGQWYNANNSSIPSGNIAYGTLNVPGTYNYTYIVGNNVCPNDTSIVSVNVLSTCDFAGVEEMKSDDFIIYPNPTSNYVYVQIFNNFGASTLELRDVHGRLLTEMSIENTNEVLEIDLTRYQRGIYFITLSGGQSSARQSVVKN